MGKYDITQKEWNESILPQLHFTREGALSHQVGPQRWPLVRDYFMYQTFAQRAAWHKDNGNLAEADEYYSLGRGGDWYIVNRSDIPVVENILGILPENRRAVLDAKQTENQNENQGRAAAARRRQEGLTQIAEHRRQGLRYEADANENQGRAAAARRQQESLTQIAEHSPAAMLCEATAADLLLARIKSAAHDMPDIQAAKRLIERTELGQCYRDTSPFKTDSFSWDQIVLETGSDDRVTIWRVTYGRWSRLDDSWDIEDDTLYRDENEARAAYEGRI